jgi:hypothetical protein
MRWHTTFSHNVTSVLSENVVSVPAENSFQPTHNMIMQSKNLNHALHIHRHPSMHVTCHYPHHRPIDGIASQDGIPSMRYCSQDTPTCVHDTAPDNTSLDRQCIRSCSHNSHLPWRRGRIDPYITTQMNGTHTIARRMSDEIKI